MHVFQQPARRRSAGHRKLRRVDRDQESLRYAHLYDLTVQPHICGGPIATAAALQLEAVIPNFIIHETHRYALLEPNTKTCKRNYLPKNGFYEVPDLPGLGQELTDETISASMTETVK
jgi:L-alanine-DL-glutamate epimerase-like enolase superfamily enzyme